MGEFCNYERLRQIAVELRAAGKRIVLLGGHFDLLHVGHVGFLASARRLGDVLIVYIPNDASTRNMKGAGRPIVPAFERAHVLAGLVSTSYSTIVPYEMSPSNITDIDLRLIRELSPAVYVCVSGDMSESRVRRIRSEASKTEVICIPPQSELWSTTRIVRALGTEWFANDSEERIRWTIQTSDESHARWIRQARFVAQRSRCAVLQVGVTIVTENRLLASACNDLPQGLSCWCGEKGGWKLTWTQPPCLAQHAEVRALFQTVRSQEMLSHATLYATHSPCIHCAKLIIEAGIRNVIYEQEFRTAAGKMLLEMAGISVARFVESAEV